VMNRQPRKIFKRGVYNIVIIPYSADRWVWIAARYNRICVAKLFTLCCNK